MGRMEKDGRIASLALRYQRGERKLLGELYRELEISIHCILRTLISGGVPLPPSMEAEDLYQQSYVALAEIVLKWKPDRNSNFTAYFLASFPWRMGRYLRMQSPTRRTSRIQLHSVPHDQLLERLADVQGADGREWDGALGCAELLEELHGLDCRIVRLHLFHGLPFAQVSKIVGISRSEAHRRYGKAILRLRALT
jgi:RNA polymerase sigma factor (sigma-70 family)